LVSAGTTSPWEDVDRRLTQLDWKEYSSLYGNIQRFHMILDVEWKRVLTPEQFRGTAAVFQRTQ
jgi:hypothetical protein